MTILKNHQEVSGWLLGHNFQSFEIDFQKFKISEIMAQKLPRDFVMIFKNRTKSADGNFRGGGLFL